MTKTLPIFAVTAMLAVAAAFPTPVQANDTGAIVGGAIGGLAVGAILGGAMAQPRYYEPAPRYYAPAYQPVYVAPRREMCVEQREVWSPRYQDYVVRNVRVPCFELVGRQVDRLLADRLLARRAAPVPPSRTRRGS